MNQDAQILRKLAYEYLTIMYDPENELKRKLQRCVNDKKMVRPIVLINEIPWHEMEIEDELTLCCHHPYLREIEQYMRRTLYQFKYCRADMVIRPYIPIPKVVSHTGIGIEVKEKTLEQANGNNIHSHEYSDMLSNEDDLEKLHYDTLAYDKDETLKRFELVADIIGDIVPVRLIGKDYAHISTWDEVSCLRGVTPLLMDLIDRPEFMHKVADKMFDILWNCMEQQAKLGLFDPDPYALHWTGILTDDLPVPENGKPLGLENVWGRAAAQIFGSVGKDMHEEFEIEYMKKTVGQCGLVYYGCCEPLHNKIDIVEKIPNLRKISITPWADVNVAAEIMGKRYVMASKPNPSILAGPVLDIDTLKKEIAVILEACKRNNVNVELTLKDISTCGHRPENIFLWEKTVMEMVENY